MNTILDLTQIILTATKKRRLVGVGWIKIDDIDDLALF